MDAPKKKILLVDDEASFAQVTKLALEARGRYEVVWEDQGGRAVARALECRPDLILLDIIMPGMDGHKVKRELEGHAELMNVPVLFLTALAFNAEATEDILREIGEENLLAKPVKMDVLIQAIESRLAGTA